LTTNIPPFFPHRAGPWVYYIWLTEGKVENGHYFGTLNLTGYYCTFIGIGQMTVRALQFTG